MYNILIFIFGAVIGSFLNVVILRLPEDKSLGGRSHCPNCGHNLKPWELIPLVSFLILRGRCSSCGKKISPRYFVIEAVTGLLFLTGWLVLPPHDVKSLLIFIEWLIVASAGVVVFVVDLEHYLILDNVIFSGLAAVLILSIVLGLVGDNPKWLLTPFLGLGGALPFFLVWWLSGGRWMGFGDVKLMLLLGAAVGLRLVPLVLLLAIFSGGLVSVFLLLFTKLTLKSRVPFGTFLTVCALVTFLWGDRILGWYLGLLGF